MAVQTAAKSKFYIGPANSTAASQTDYEALSYEVVREIANLGEFGPEFQAVEWQSLDDDTTTAFKGARNDGSMDISLGRSLSDAGQAALKAAVEQHGGADEFAFKVVLNDQITPTTGNPTTFYFRGRAMSYRTSIGGPNDIVQATTSIRLTTKPVEIEAT